MLLGALIDGAFVGAAEAGVSPPNNQPPIVDSSVTIDAAIGGDSCRTINGFDPDGDLLTYTLSFLPALGEASIAGPQVCYTPRDTSAGRSDSFRVEVTDGTNPVTVNIFVDISRTGRQIEGTSRNNVLTGTAGDDRIFGFAGNDRLDGGRGADYLDGGDGDLDVFIVDNPDDEVVDFGGSVMSSVTFALPPSFGPAPGSAAPSDLTLTGRAKLDATGNGFDNRLTGNSGQNRLRGLGGDDTLEGLGGSDIIDGGDGNDTVSYARSPSAVRVNLRIRQATGGHAVADRLVSIESVTGSRFNDILTGNLGNNVLSGGAGDDEINGGGASTSVDILNGGPGADQLTGGDGAARFVFIKGDSGPTRFDTITDFKADKGDLIDLTGYLIKPKRGLSRYIEARAFSGRAGEVRFAGDRLEIDDNGDRKADFVVRVIVASGSITERNIRIK